jgi:hypothetical protein
MPTLAIDAALRTEHRRARRSTHQRPATPKQSPWPANISVSQSTRQETQFRILLYVWTSSLVHDKDWVAELESDEG